jgi:hypothetical protein
MHKMPIHTIPGDDPLTRNLVSGIASRALHRVLAVGIEITPKKPLHLYSDGIAVSFHSINKTRFRVTVLGINNDLVYINADISAKGGVEVVHDITTSVEEFLSAHNINYIGDIEYRVGQMTDRHIQDLADKERSKREKN